MTKESKPVHVTRQGNQWVTKKEGSQEPSSVSKTQAKAIEKGRTEAKSSKTELIIHGRDGKIRARDSYGPDPFPPKG